jgi:DNA-binding MarR family transcriptional regulator
MAIKEQEDHVDRLRAQWARELPDLDTTAMAVLGRVYRLSQLVGPGIDAIFARYGIDRGEFDVLGTLRRSGRPYRLTPTQLYAALMVPSGSLTHRLGRLERAGLIVRKRSDRDRRSISVELSKKGERLASKAFRADMESELRLMARLSDADIIRMAAMLKKLTLAVEEMLPAVK